MTGPADPIARNAPLRRAALLVLVAAALILSCFHVTNLDIGGHLTVGREILKTGAIPDAEFFSHTSTGHPYPVHQWLGEVILFGVEHLTGANGLILLRMTVTLLGALLLYRNARREGAPVAVAVGIVLLLLVAVRPRLFIRPFLVSWIFLPLLHGWILDVREGRTRRLWPMLPLLAIWGHLHSGVLFGVLMLGAVVVGEGVKILAARGGARSGPDHRFPGPPLDGWNYRRLLLFSAIAVALPFATMALVNPSGLKPLILPFLFFQNAGFQQMIAEYRTVDLTVDWPFNLVAGALLLGVLLRRKQVDLTDLLLAIGFGILAYQAVRGILPFAATAAPLLGRTWGALAEDLFERATRSKKRGGSAAARGRANLAEALVLVLGIGGAAFVGTKAVRGWGAPFGFGKDPKHYPDRALDFLYAQDFRGQMFNTDLWASSFLWRFHGKRYPVFVDARLEAYPESFWPDVYYRVLNAAPGWEDVLDRFGVEFAFVRREGGQTDDRIGEALWEHEGWGLVYWDDRVMIFLRRDTEQARNRKILSRWEFDAFSPRRPSDVRDLDADALAHSVERLERLREWTPDSFLLGWTLAAARARQGLGGEAVALYDGLAGRDEADDNAAFAASRAEAELIAGDREAWAAGLRATGRDPESPEECFRAAADLAKIGQRERAIGLYREVIARRPGDDDARNNLALLLAEEDGGIEEALTLLDAALTRAPKDPYFLASRGEVLLRAGRREEAHAELRRSLDLLPADDVTARRHVMHWILRAE